MQVYLETERLALRHFTGADVDRLVALDSDRAVMKFLTGGRPTPRDTIVDEVLPRLIASYDDIDGYGVWAADERASGQFVGWFALQPREGRGADEPELGYRLRRASWGRGYATEGSRALIRKAFTELGALSVLAETMAVNLASRRVMERLGMTHLRTFHETWEDPIEGVEHGEVEYRITRDEWERQTGSNLDPPTLGRV